MGKIYILLDTSVLIKVWRGDDELENELAAYACGVETVASLEFLQGANKRQEAKADKFLKRYEFVPFKREISFRAIALIREFAHTKGLRMPDALIAATTIENGLPLLTLNTRHFEFIKDIELI